MYIKYYLYVISNLLMQFSATSAYSLLQLICTFPLKVYIILTISARDESVIIFLQITIICIISRLQ